MSLLIPVAGNTAGVKAFLMILASSLVAACASATNTDSYLDRSLSEADREVSRAVIAALFPGFGSSLVVEQETRPRVLQADWVSAELHGIPAETLAQMIESYLQRNKRRSAIPLEVLPKGAQLMALAEVEELAATDMESGWRKFHQRYGEAAIRVSLSIPGYSPGTDTALVYSTQSRGPLTGESVVIVLQKAANGTWKVVAQAQVAIW